MKGLFLFGMGLLLIGGMAVESGFLGPTILLTGLAIMVVSGRHVKGVMLDDMLEDDEWPDLD